MLKRTIQTPENSKFSSSYNNNINNEQEQKECTVKTEEQIASNQEARNEIKKGDINDFEKNDNDELILPHDPTLTENISVPQSELCLQTPKAFKRRTLPKKSQKKTSDEIKPEANNCPSYSLLSSDDEVAIVALPACPTVRDPLECPEENARNYNSNNNKQIIKTATATLHISKNITVKRITNPKYNFSIEGQKKKVTENKSEFVSKWQRKRQPTAALVSTPQSNFLDAIDLRPTVPAECTLHRVSQSNRNVEISHLHESSNPACLNTAYQYSWLQEFVKQFVDPKLSPSQVCFLLLQRVFSYKEYHRIKTLRNDISIKGSMIDNLEEHYQNLDRKSNLKRLQQQLQNELRRSFLYRHQLTKQGEQFWQITTSNMNAARTLSQARILMTHRLTGAVTLKTHNYSFEESPTKRQVKYHNFNSNGNSNSCSLTPNSSRMDMDPNYRGIHSYRERIAREKKEEEYKPPYKIRQESMQQEQIPGSDENSLKRSLRVRTKRHYDDNFTYDDEMLMNYWEDVFEDMSIQNKRNLSKLKKEEWKNSRQQPSVLYTSNVKNDDSGNANNTITNDMSHTIEKSSYTKNGMLSLQIPPTNAKNTRGDNDDCGLHISRASYNNQWPLNIDREIHTNCERRDICVICKKVVACVVQHYVNAHRGAEVYVSRLSEDQIQYLRNNNNNKHPPRNMATLNVYKNGQIQYKTMCIFCLKTPSFMLNYWYKHFTIHTGEYAYRCIDCGVRKPTRYLLTQYHDQERQSSSNALSNMGMNEEESINEAKADCYYHSANIVQDYNFDSKVKEIVAYLCTLCNYIQMQRKNIMKHLYTQHHIKCILPQHTEKLILLRIPDGYPVTDTKRRAGRQVVGQQFPTFFSERLEKGRSDKNDNKESTNNTKIITTINLDDSSDSSIEALEPLNDTSHDIDHRNSTEDSYMDQGGGTDYGDDLSYMICGMLDVEIITK